MSQHESPTSQPSPVESTGVTPEKQMVHPVAVRYDSLHGYIPTAEEFTTPGDTITWSDHVSAQDGDARRALVTTEAGARYLVVGNEVLSLESADNGQASWQPSADEELPPVTIGEDWGGVAKVAKVEIQGENYRGYNDGMVGYDYSKYEANPRLKTYAAIHEQYEKRDINPFEGAIKELGYRVSRRENALHAQQHAEAGTAVVAETPQENETDTRVITPEALEDAQAVVGVGVLAVAGASDNYKPSLVKRGWNRIKGAVWSDRPAVVALEQQGVQFSRREIALSIVQGVFIEGTRAWTHIARTAGGNGDYASRRAPADQYDKSAAGAYNGAIRSKVAETIVANPELASSTATSQPLQAFLRQSSLEAQRSFMNEADAIKRRRNGEYTLAEGAARFFGSMALTVAGVALVKYGVVDHETASNLQPK
jgi:hypothetical protein